MMSWSCSGDLYSPASPFLIRTSPATMCAGPGRDCPAVPVSLLAGVFSKPGCLQMEMNSLTSSCDL